MAEEKRKSETLSLVDQAKAILQQSEVNSEIIRRAPGFLLQKMFDRVANRYKDFNFGAKLLEPEVRGSLGNRAYLDADAYYQRSRETSLDAIVKSSFVPWLIKHRWTLVGGDVAGVNEINVALGKPGGDRAIAEVATQFDVVAEGKKCRLGGDELGKLFPPGMPVPENFLDGVVTQVKNKVKAVFTSRDGLIFKAVELVPKTEFPGLHRRDEPTLPLEKRVNRLSMYHPELEKWISSVSQEQKSEAVELTEALLFHPYLQSVAEEFSDNLPVFIDQVDLLDHLEIEGGDFILVRVDQPGGPKYANEHGGYELGDALMRQNFWVVLDRARSVNMLENTKALIQGADIYLVVPKEKGESLGAFRDRVQDRLSGVAKVGDYGFPTFTGVAWKDFSVMKAGLDGVVEEANRPVLNQIFGELRTQTWQQAFGQIREFARLSEHEGLEIRHVDMEPIRREIIEWASWFFNPFWQQHNRRGEGRVRDAVHLRTELDEAGIQELLGQTKEFYHLVYSQKYGQKVWQLDSEKSQEYWEFIKTNLLGIEALERR